MHASKDPGSGSGTNLSDESLTDEPPSTAVEDSSNLNDEERGLGRGPLPSQLVPQLHALSGRSRTSGSGSPDNHDETELQTRPNSIASSTGRYIKRKTSQLLEAVSSSAQGNKQLSPKLAALVEAYAESEIARAIKREWEELRRETERAGEGRGVLGPMNDLPDVALETSLLRGRKRASWGTQFRILSGRAFKNLYRDPALLAAHYLSSIALACKSYLRLVVIIYANL
jgi:hypothetical protein